MPKCEEIPFNAIATVQLFNVAKNIRSNKFTTLRLRRSIPTPNAPLESFTSPQPSMLPTPPSRPPGKLALRLSLGNQIGEGGCGLIYEATDVSLTGRSPAYSQSMLPPLVVKICRNFKHYKLPREAFMYEEMESLHGLVVARYYGCFEAVIPPGVTFPVWQMEDEEQGSDLHDVDHPNTSRVVTMIVMERLGDQRLPTKQPIDKRLRFELFHMFSHLSNLGIWHGDIRYANIVSAPESPPGLRGHRCPEHGLHRHKWRIIDFELSRKTGVSPKNSDIQYQHIIRTFLKRVESGEVLLPW